MGFYFNQKDQDFYPLSFLSGFSRSTGRSIAAWSRSTERSTDVHRRARLCALEGRSTDPVDRQRASALWKAPVDRAGRPAESLTLCSRGSVDRSPNDRISDRWRSTGSFDWPITASFWSPINWAIWGLFYRRFLVGFWASFSYSIKRVFSTKLRANTSNQKGSFIKVIFEVSSTISILIFSHKHMSYPLIIHFIGVL